MSEDHTALADDEVTEETVTFHFDLSHLSDLPDDVALTLKSPGRLVTLRRHTPETLARHAEGNAALRLLSAEDRSRFTHFAETVTVPTDAVSFCWVGYPSRRPGAVSDEIAVIFQHVPRMAVRRAVRLMNRDSILTVPAVVHHAELTGEMTSAGLADLHLDASLMAGPRDTAIALVMQHPDVASMVPTDNYLIQELVCNHPAVTEDLATYLSSHGPNSEDPYYDNRYATDSDGAAVAPIPLRDKDNREVVWPSSPEGDKVKVIPQFDLSDGLNDVLARAVRAVCRTLMQTNLFKGRHWATQHGVTALSRSDTPVAQNLQSESTPLGSRWTIAGKTSLYGLDLYQDSISFDSVSRALSFNVKNWPNRGLGAFVQFFGDNGTPLDPPEWIDLMSGWEAWVRPDDKTKKYLKLIGAGNTVFGIPMPTPKTEIAFAVPEAAVGANILFSGLGNSGRDFDVDRIGLIYTSVVSYGIPNLLRLMTVGVKTSKWYTECFQNDEQLKMLWRLTGLIYLEINLAKRGPEKVLAIVASHMAGLIFSKGMEWVAMKVAAYVTAEQIVDSTPFVGWALKVASLVAAVADITATTVNICLSPTTYKLEAKSSMALDVSVGPDPKHEKWPAFSDHYEISVLFPGGTTLTKKGQVDAETADPIAVRFAWESGDAVPSAPGAFFTIQASVYSANGWLCGKWESDRIQAIPTTGNTRTEKGAITERRVPLTAATRYQETKKLDRDASGRKLVWGPPDSPSTVSDGPGLPVHDPRETVAMTINSQAHRLGYTYWAGNQDLPMNYDSAVRSDPMYLMRCVGTLTDPNTGMLAPARGFSAPSPVAFDDSANQDAAGTKPSDLNFFLDPRTYGSCGALHVRLVNLADTSRQSFDYDSRKSWGAFRFQSLDALAVHPHGYLVGVSSHDDKLAILTLPSEAVEEQDAPEALPFCGNGIREGLLRSPKAVSIADDGRILVLEDGNQRIQAFDTRGNPVHCFTGPLQFTVDLGIGAQLDRGTAEPSLLQALQRSVPVAKPVGPRDDDGNPPRYLCAPAFSMPSDFAAGLDAGTVTPELLAQFDKNGLTLGSDVTIARTAPGLWLLVDGDPALTYDIRLNGEAIGDIDVYRGFSPTIIAESPGSEWLVMDKTHTITFHVTTQPDTAGLVWRERTALMPLKRGRVRHLDLAVESKGFIYVLSYINDGTRPSDYRLDIYNPDGSPLNADPAAHNGILPAGRMAVDQWRTLFTLNYFRPFIGPDGRTQPSVSQWDPPPPPPGKDQ